MVLDNRRGGGHTGHARDMSQWENFLSVKIDVWRKINMDWMQFMPPDKLLIVSYSQLQQDLSSQLMRMTRFLNISVDSYSLDCAISKSDGGFKRPKLSQAMGKITKTLEDKIDVVRKEIVSAARNLYSDFNL